MGDLLSFGMRPLIGLLNKGAAGHGSPGPISVDHICNKTRNMSSLVSKHFLLSYHYVMLHSFTFVGLKPLIIFSDADVECGTFLVSMLMSSASA